MSDEHQSPFTGAATLVNRYGFVKPAPSGAMNSIIALKTLGAGCSFHRMNQRQCVTFLSVLTGLTVAMGGLVAYVMLQSRPVLPSFSIALLLVGFIYALCVIPSFWRRAAEMRRQASLVQIH
jgi:hypothetical protein